MAGIGPQPPAGRGTGRFGSDVIEQVARAAPGTRVVGDADQMRDRLLEPPLRGSVLTFAEICDAGLALFGDPEGLSLYGQPPSSWYPAGIRILGRTAAEATPDATSERIVRGLRQYLARATRSGSVGVVDLFAGSGNLAFHLSRAFDATGVGIELDPMVYGATETNLSMLGDDRIELRLGSWQDYFLDPIYGQDVTIFVVAPPWGAAFTFGGGLDLTKTSPPVIDVMDHIASWAPGRKRYVVVQVPTHEPLVPASLGVLQRRHLLVGKSPSCLLFSLDEHDA